MIGTILVCAGDRTLACPRAYLNRISILGATIARILLLVTLIQGAIGGLHPLSQDSILLGDDEASVARVRVYLQYNIPREMFNRKKNRICILLM